MVLARQERLPGQCGDVRRGRRRDEHEVVRRMLVSQRVHTEAVAVRVDRVGSECFRSAGRRDLSQRDDTARSWSHEGGVDTGGTHAVRVVVRCAGEGVRRRRKGRVGTSLPRVRQVHGLRVAGILRLDPTQAVGVGLDLGGVVFGISGGRQERWHERHQLIPLKGSPQVDVERPVR